MSFYAYVIKSSVDGRFYKGMTESLEKRLAAHNSGKVRATKGFRPWVLVYFEEHSTMEQARAREVFLKSGQGRDFIKALNL